MRRRQAVDKINSLPEASPEQLQEFDDVCAICYQDMLTARITRCNHYFHGVCLRKWLYVQDICPLCHDVLYMETETNPAAENNNDVSAEAHPQPEEDQVVLEEAGQEAADSQQQGSSGSSSSSSGSGSESTSQESNNN